MQHGTEAANDDQPVATSKAELFFGFVGPTGVDLDLVCETLSGQLQQVGYETRTVALGDLIDPFMGTELRLSSEFERLDALISKDVVARDAEIGHDANVQAKTELVVDALARMKARGWLAPHLSEQAPDALARSALLGRDAFLRQARLFDVIEYGRAVHAEMAAITQAAKDGRSLKGTRLYCTTFPCHLCARHIVASGIEEVFFIEPYEKSRARQLHGDAISVEPDEPSRLRANFRAFVGVAPRRYMDFFSVGALPRKTEDGRALRRSRREWEPRFRSVALHYILEEQKLLRDLPDNRQIGANPSPTTKAA